MKQNLLILLGGFFLLPLGLNAATIDQSDATNTTSTDAVVSETETAINDALASIEEIQTETPTISADASVAASELSTAAPVVDPTGITVGATRALKPASTLPTFNKANATRRTVGATKNKDSNIWDKMLKLLNIEKEALSKKRSCADAFKETMDDKTVSIDLSDTTDFAQNGDDIMTQFMNKLKTSNSFGTSSPNIYVNLANTGVTPAFVKKWSDQFKAGNKTVIWNLSENKTVDDTMIDSIDIPSIYSLNLTNTNVTDATIQKLITAIQTNGIGRLVNVTLTGTKVTEQAVEQLKQVIKQSYDSWVQKNPTKNKPNLEGMDDSGVTYEKALELPKVEKRHVSRPNLSAKVGATAPQTNALQSAPVAQQLTTSVEPTPSVEPTIDVTQTTIDVTQPVIDTAPAIETEPTIQEPVTSNAEVVVAEVPAEVASEIEATPAISDVVVTDTPSTDVEATPVAEEAVTVTEEATPVTEEAPIVEAEAQAAADATQTTETTVAAA